MYMISMETIKTIAQGALGSMSFGAYHMYVTKSMIEVNNEMIFTKNQIIQKEIDEMRRNNEELKKRLDKRWL
jgi:hypothetical protein